MLGPDDLRKFMEQNSIEGEFIFLKPNEARTSETAASAVGCPLSQIAKNIVLIGSQPYIIVLAGDRKIDLRKFATVVGERVRLATPEEVLTITGYEVGDVPPFGHITSVKLFIDSSIKHHTTVYTSGGAHNVLVKINIHPLLELAGSNIVDVSR